MFEHKNKRELEYKKVRSIYKKEERKIFFSRFYSFFYYFLLLSFMGVSIHAILFAPFLEINNIEIIGVKNLEIEKVYMVAENSKNGKILGILPRKNLILFSSSSLQKSLEDNFKRIKKLEVSKKFPNKIHISIEERESLILWCTPKQECFIIDEDGIAYNKTTLDSREVSENNLIKINSGENDRNINEGEKIFSRERVSFLMTLLKDFVRFSGIDVINEINLNSRMAEEIVLKTTDGKYIILNTEISIQKSAEILKAGIEKEIKEDISVEDIEGFDLRVENRIYYKMKKMEQETEETEKIKD